MIVRRFHKFLPLMREKPTNLQGKKHSSQQWIVRQLKDPYVEKAKQSNYRCRSAFKLLEINKKLDIIEPGYFVVDCGAAPGSWTQVATHLCNSNGDLLDEKMGKVIAIDRLPIHPINGAITFGNLDFQTQMAQQLLCDALDGKFVDVVLSDMAPNASGIKEFDHQNIIKLAYSAFEFALKVTVHEGTFVTKVWDGYLSTQLENDIAKFYQKIKIVRPAATREESSEKFIVARGFKGIKTKPF